MKATFLAVLLVPGVALACPAQDLSAERAPHFETLAAAPDPAAAQRAADQIWISWHTAPDAHAQDLLNQGLRHIRYGEPAAAEPVLTELIEYCPDYAEGWNQRAFARFLTGAYDGALEDLDRTLELEPRHFGALAGKGLTLLRQGRAELAHKALREALAIHPFIPEGQLLPKGEKI